MRAGQTRAGELRDLLLAATAWNAVTGALCASGPSCAAFTAIECVPAGADACLPDGDGNVGYGNLGRDNFGGQNVGSHNVGERASDRRLLYR